jgi:chloride channel 7
MFFQYRNIVNSKNASCNNFVVFSWKTKRFISEPAPFRGASNESSVAVRGSTHTRELRATRNMSAQSREVIVNVRVASEDLSSPARRADEPASNAQPARLPEPHLGTTRVPEDDRSRFRAPDECTSTGVLHRRTSSKDSVLSGTESPYLTDDETEYHPDPVADATMAKILNSASSTRLGRNGSVFNLKRDGDDIERGREESRRGAGDATTREESARMHSREADASAEAGRTPEPSSSEKTTGGTFSDRPSTGNTRVLETTLTSSAETAVGFSRRLLRSATRALFPSGGRSIERRSPSVSDDDGKPPIRLRRTPSYYVFAGEGASRGTSFASSTPRGRFAGARSNDPEDDSFQDRLAARRKDELATFRRRVADSGKLLASVLAGLFAGVVLWAMTTVTAHLTQMKFDATRDLLSRVVRDEGRHGVTLATAWAFYAGCAVLAIGITAAYVTHPRGAPMSRGSGIPELKGYLNGNRQRGLFHWRTFAGRSVGICLVITATMPFGREGPSVHIGACAASAVLNVVPWRARLGWQPSPEERRQILQLGSAAGVAAAFNAPIGGLLYVMEEIATSLPTDYVWRAMLVTGTAVGSAQILYAANEGRVDYSSLVISDPDSSTGWSPSDLPLIAVLSILAGAFSALFTLCADFFGNMRRGGNTHRVEDRDEVLEQRYHGSSRYASGGGAGTERSAVAFLRLRLRRGFKNIRAFYFTRAGAWFDAVLGALCVASAQLYVPALFTCRTAPEIREENGSVYSGRRMLSSYAFFETGRDDREDFFREDVSFPSVTESSPFGRALLSTAVYIPRTFVQYTCKDGDFNEMATLMLQNEEGVVKHLFAKDDMYSEELFSPTTVLVFLGYFFVAASVTFGSAFPAGVFIPNMLMGAALGRLFGSVAELINPNAAPKGTYALIGSAAMLSGFTRMTAAVTVIIIEATASLDVLAPIILACVVSRAVAGALIGPSLDERLIVAKGVPFLEHDAHPSTVSMKIGDALKESELRRGEVIAFRPRERLRVLLNALLLTEHNAFPVLEDVERNERVVGLVTRAMLQRVLRMVFEETEGEESRSKLDEAGDERGLAEPRSGFSEAVVEILSSSLKSPGSTRVSAGSTRASKRTSSRSKGSSPGTSKGIDKWSVEGLRGGSAARGSTSSRVSASAPTSRTSSLDARDDSIEHERHEWSEGGEFVRSVARWVAQSKLSKAKNRVFGCGGVKRTRLETVAAKVTSAAAAADETPANTRADDENHFDELKEGLVREIRNGVKSVPESQLRRMVDLTHAVDKAPWTVDRNTRLGRVHALFARVGVRHLCVTTDGGNRLEGIITRHDLIHVHRMAEGHA